jgi:hypothetical protein
MIDYFSPADTPEEEALRIIKGNFRRVFIEHQIAMEGFQSIPPAWLKHNLSQKRVSPWIVD